VKTRDVALTALLLALTCVATMVVRVPVPATQGYFNLGDTMVFVSALLFGPQVGMIAGGLGSGLADVLGGYPHWAPFTLVIKGLEGLVVGVLVLGASRWITYGGAALAVGAGIAVLFAGTMLAYVVGVLAILVGLAALLFGAGDGSRGDTGRAVSSCLLGGGVMALGYFVVQAFWYGVGAATVEMPANMMQGVAGLIVAVPIWLALRRQVNRPG